MFRDDRLHATFLGLYVGHCPDRRGLCAGDAPGARTDHSAARNLSRSPAA